MTQLMFGKTIYTLSNSTNIHTIRRRDARRIQANPVGGSSHSPRTELWLPGEIWLPRAQVYEGVYITEDDIYREINLIQYSGDAQVMHTVVIPHMHRCWHSI